jgi:hypothetical protein
MKLSPAAWMVLGIATLLFFKYVFFGLSAWDSVLHPGRNEPAASPFLKPFFGVFA